MTFPHVRLRRFRQTPAWRDLVAETTLTPADFIWPMFLVEGRHQSRPIPSMPGIVQQSLENALIEIDHIRKLGIKAIMLFGVPDEKDAQATAAADPHGLIQTATRTIKQHFGQDILVFTDTCLCEYTSHGHCGLVMDGAVLNDPSIEALAQVAVSQAEAGSDMVCPSDMMDGRVQAIRWALDEAGLSDTPIMSYPAKFASALYAPFRDAAASAPSFGDRRTYQLDPRNAREALLEVEQDLLEGADMLMLKPALGYLDIVARVRQETNLPLAVYNVSGEYSMLKAAAAQGWLDETTVALELLTSIKRAGADLIISYHARDIAAVLSSS